MHARALAAEVEADEGCRCSRSCYDCPSCTAPLAVTQIRSPREEGLLKPSDAAGGNESYILQCQYCDWSSLEIGVQFSKSTKITEQLTKLRKAKISSEQDKEPPDRSTSSHDDAFTNLTNFYKDQLGGSGDAQNPYPNSPYSSPANLARIMSLYGGLPYNALKKSREKPQPLREALYQSEGLTTFSQTPSHSDTTTIHQMQHLGWENTTSSEQRHSTPANSNVKSTPHLWPAATPLRTRRGRRCKTCRQFLTRPEQKVGSMKYKIRLLAVNHIPRLSIRPLQQQQQPSSSSSTMMASTTTNNPAVHYNNILRSDYIHHIEQQQQERLLLLQPYQTNHYILTIRNPIFESVRISLATPATTPGRIASRVTILCPSFTVGPAGEIWDDALASSSSSTHRSTSDFAAGGGRSAAMASLTGSSESAAERQPEAGKIWERTRNSTSVVVEIVPGAVQGAAGIVPTTTEEEREMELEEDDEVLQVPVYVRAEWEVEVKPGESVHGRKDGEKVVGERARKELGYWVVLGVGRIGS